jgi:Tfp pilus assembly protein PilF
MRRPPTVRNAVVAALAVAAALAGAGASRAAESSSAAAQLEFGVTMARRGLWNEAVFRFEAARRSEPGNVRALNNLAVAYEAVGRFDDALAAYRDALRADPNNRRLRQNYQRFVEFYQSFRPRAAEGEAAPAPPVAAPELPPSSGGDA